MAVGSGCYGALLLLDLDNFKRQAEPTMYQARANGRDQARVYAAAGAEVAQPGP